MSESVDSPRPARDAFGRLETAVDVVLDRVSELESRLRVAEARARELDGVLKRISEGELQPSDLLDRLRSLEGENDRLRERLDQGREGVERLLAKIRFLEEQR